MLLIVRNPFDAIVAEYSRRNSGGHIGTLDSSIFGNSFSIWGLGLPYIVFLSVPAQRNLANPKS